MGSEQDLSRRAVVTGVGLLTPVGIGTEATWESLVAGRSGIGRVLLGSVAERVFGKATVPVMLVRPVTTPI